MSVFEDINLFLLLSGLAESKRKQALSCLRVICWVGFETPHFRHESAVFTWVHDCCFLGSEAGCLASEITSQGSMALAPCGKAWTQDSALQQLILVAFSLHSLIFQMCIFLIWYVLFNPLDKFCPFYIFLLPLKNAWLDESKTIGSAPEKTSI